MRFVVKDLSQAGQNRFLDVFIQRNGILVDPFALQFLVRRFSATGAVTVQGLTDALPNRKSIGRFFPAFTATVTNELHEIEWRLKFDDGDEDIFFSYELEAIQDVGSFQRKRCYCLMVDLSEEGADTAANVDFTTVEGARRALKAISQASSQIEQFTNRTFHPEAKTVTLDGRGGPDLQIDEPIIGLSGIQILSHAFGAESTIVDTELEDVSIYNRHLRGIEPFAGILGEATLDSGLLDPDDRDNPMISFRRLHDHLGNRLTETRPLFPHHVFPFGQQNVSLSGVYGYTEPNGGPTGDVPELIRRACVLMAGKLLNPDFSAGSSAQQPAGPIVEEKTRDQTVKYAAPKNLGGLAPGPFTGDPDVDNILLAFSRPARIGAA